MSETFPIGGMKMTPLPPKVKATEMLLRDYFAGQFLTTIHIHGEVEASVIAKHCYEMADAMLKEREQ